MKKNWIAPAVHISVVLVVYVAYAIYPPYEFPIPFFGHLLGLGYGIAGILVLLDYALARAKKPTPSKFHRSALLLIVGGLLFIAETIGNAS
jgi:hypothetical protein